MACILVEEPYMFYPHVLSCYLDKLLHKFMGMTEKARRAAVFLSWYGNFKPLSLRSGSLLLYTLGLDIISFLHKHVFVVFLSYFLFQH
jgi:hypothetical protein